MLSLRLHTPYRRLQKELSSTDFVLYQVFLKEEMNYSKVENYYLAQIAAEMRRFVSKDPSKPKTEDFLLKFTMDGPEEEREETEAEFQLRMEMIKAPWLAMAGYSKKQPNKKKSTLRPLPDKVKKATAEKLKGMNK